MRSFFLTFQIVGTAGSGYVDGVIKTADGGVPALSQVNGMRKQAVERAAEKLRLRPGEEVHAYLVSCMEVEDDMPPDGEV